MLNAGLVALLIFFLVQSLILRMVYSILFSCGIYYLQTLLFINDQNNVTPKHIKKGAFGNRNLLIYFFGFIASVIVLTFPPFDASPGSQALYVVFAKIPPFSVIRVISGYFLIGVFPGYVVFNSFLSKRDFDAIEEMGLILALSYAINGFIGSLLISLHPALFSCAIFLLILWGSIFLMNFIRRLALREDKHFPNSDAYLPTKFSKRTLFLVSFLILISSYTLVFSCDVGDLALSGDITRYISQAIAIRLGQQPQYLTRTSLFLIFPLVAQLLTGLHAFYAYAGLQFYLLIVPTSFYILLKALFPQDTKIPTTGAFLGSVTSGLGFIGLWDFFTKYASGEKNTFSALLDAWSKAPLIFIPYQFYVMPIAYSLLFMALSFMYRYVFQVGGQRRLSHLLLCGLFVTRLPFTHDIFESSFFVVSLIICFFFFVPISRRSMTTFFKIIAAVMLFFIPQEVILRAYQYTFINYFFHFKHFFGYFRLSLELVVLPLVMIVTCIFLRVFFHKHKPDIYFQHCWKMIFDNFTFKVGFWMIAFMLFILTIYCWRIDWMDLYFRTMEWPPWYITIMSYGFYFSLAIGMVPNLLGKKQKRGLLIILSWLVSISILTLLSVFLPVFFTPMVWGRRWLLSFAFYPFVALTAAALSEVSSKFPDLNIHVDLQMKSKIKTVNTPDLRYFASSFLILLISFSFLTCAYTAELFYTGALVQTGVSSSETEAFSWILHNTPEDAIILTVTERSTVRIGSLACRKSLGYSDVRKSWPLQVLFNSRLPEAVLYSLKQLCISYIFITPEDSLSLAENLQNTYLNSLLDILPVVYEKEKMTLFAVPRYPLYEYSNCVLVSPTLDFQNISVARVTLEFSDDFNTNLNNWGIISGDWEIENGELHTLGTRTINNWGRIVSNQSFTNFIYEFKGKSVKSPGLSYIWGVFRYLDESNYYSFYIGNTTFTVFEKVGGVSSALAGGHLEASLNLTQWNSVKIDTTYSRIKLYINNNLVTTMQGTGLEGKVGLQTHAEYHTCYDDVKVTSLTLPVDTESALQNYQFAFNMFMTSKINFTIMSDIDLTGLKANNVYVFPFNRHVPGHVLSNLEKYVSEGAHVLFLDQLFGAYDELYSIGNPVLHSMLRVRMGGIIACSEVSFGGRDIHLGGEYVIHMLTLENSSGINVLANYTINNQSQTAFIIQKQIGKGTITYIHLTDLMKQAMAKIPQRTLLAMSFHESMKSLPKPAETRTQLSLPFPSGLYRFLLINDIPALLSLKDLHGYAYAFGSSIAMNGSCRVRSNYVLMVMSQIKIKKLEVSNTTDCYMLENETFSYLNLKGSVDLSLQTNNIRLTSPYYGGKMTTIYIPESAKLHIKLIDAELLFKTNLSNAAISFAEGNITIIISSLYSDLLRMSLKQPVIEIDGSLKLASWQGIFWYGDKAIIMFSTHSSIVKGDLSVQLIYQFGGVLIKIVDVQSVDDHEVYS